MTTLTKPSQSLTLADRLSRLSFVDACKLLGPEGRKLIQRGGKYEVDIDEQVHFHGDLFRLAPAQLELLYTACRDHTDGEVTDDPTLGVCWDADRLNLWRAAIAPNPRWLSTAPAKDTARIQWAKSLQARRFTWDAVYDAFSRLR